MSSMPEMTYEQFVERLPALTAELQKYEEWRNRARMTLLTDIAPRVAKLSQQFYLGCGFHYGMEQQLGKAIDALALGFQFTANHCAKIPEYQTKMIINQVAVEMLIQSVVEAEKSVKRRQS